VIGDPDILLLAVVVFSTKLCFPFEGGSGSRRENDSFPIPNVSWAKWVAAVEVSSEEYQRWRAVDPRSVTTEELVSMSPQKLDAFFAIAAAEVDNRGMTADNSLLLIWIWSCCH